MLKLSRSSAEWTPSAPSLPRSPWRAHGEHGKRGVRSGLQAMHDLNGSLAQADRAWDQPGYLRPVGDSRVAGIRRPGDGRNVYGADSPRSRTQRLV